MLSPSTENISDPKFASDNINSLHSASGHDVDGTGEGQSSSRVQPNGILEGGRVPGLIEEGKTKAKAIVAASGVPLEILSEKRSSSQNSDLAYEVDGNGRLDGGAPSRKRSRSGTRIPRHRSREHSIERASSAEKEWRHERLLEQYVMRDLIHVGSILDDERYQSAQIKSLREEWLKYESWLRPKTKDDEITRTAQLPIRQTDPGTIFGRGYSGYGNGTTDLFPQHNACKMLYPAQRPSAGGRRTRQLRIPKKDLATQAEQLEELVPIRLDIEWDKIRLRDTFTWNLHDRTVDTRTFAEGLVEDFKLPPEQCGPIVDQVHSSLTEQIQDYHPHVFIREEALDPHLPYHAYKDDEMRITIKLNITIGQHTLVDQFEWDINNTMNNAEDFARSMTQDLSLSGEFSTAIAHSIREQSQLFTRSLYVTGHPFDGRPIEDQEVKASFLPSPLPSSFRPYQAAKDFTPYLYELNEAELEKTELSLSREERRQKRSVNRRGGPALPDLKDRRRTIRTLVVSSVLPGAAEVIEDSRILKRAPAPSGRSRRSGYNKDGLDDSDESDSEGSSPGSPAIPSYLLAGTARTRGMRGAATVAQAAIRSNIGRSATPEASTLHHHETRTSGRKVGGGKDYREESAEASDLIVKLKLPREKYRQLMRNLKSKSKPEPLQSVPASSHLSSRRSQSATPGHNTPAVGSMPPPPTTPSTQPQTSSPNRNGQQPQGPNSASLLHPHSAAQIGRVDARGPPSQENPIVRGALP